MSEHDPVFNCSPGLIYIYRQSGVPLPPAINPFDYLTRVRPFTATDAHRVREAAEKFCFGHDIGYDTTDADGAEAAVQRWILDAPRGVNRRMKWRKPYCAALGMRPAYGLTVAFDMICLASYTHNRPPLPWVFPPTHGKSELPTLNSVNRFPTSDELWSARGLPMSSPAPTTPNFY